MSEKPNDSPAFRLRPRAEPKSYYSIRLEYSANPAAFTRERPRSGVTKKRSTSSKSSYSRSKQQSNKLNAAPQSVLRHERYAPSVPLASPVKLENVVSKEDVEREERRKQLRRGISQSITTDTMISPFMQRLSVDELKPSVVYDQNYITLKIEKVISKQQASGTDGASGAPHVVCKCSIVSLNYEIDYDDNNSPTFINVHLYDEYANENLLKVGKILNIAKFKTGPETKPTGNHVDEQTESSNARCVQFDVIVRYDDKDKAAACSAVPPPPPPPIFLPVTPPQSSSLRDAISGTTTTINTNTNQLKSPMIPFVSIADMIEQPTEPYVEMAPASPPPLAAAAVANKDL